MRAGSLAAAPLALAAASAIAQVAPDWQVTGTNTLRAERYGSSGDPLQSPYRLDLGAMGYDEFNVSGRRQDSPFASWRFLVAGVLNGSPYRSPHDGVVPERLSLVREDGEAPVPFRAEAGDFFAFTSLRTLQRPLKGISVELQPALADPGLRQSLVLFGGAFQPSWRDAQWGDDNSIGASWLLDGGAAGRLAATALSNGRRGAPALQVDKRRQFVGSVAGETSHEAAGWRLRVEGEAAMFRGDHEGDGMTAAQDRRDAGYYAQVSGFDARWNWRLRGERYGQDYRPWGAVVPADRRSAEAHLAYGFAGGLTLRGRYQDYRDQAETANPLDTRVAGANLAGPLGALGANLLVDAFVQDQERRDGSLDARFRSASASLSRAFAGGWVGQLSLLRQDTDNRLDGILDYRTSQAQASVILPFRAGDLAGNVTPGLLWRETKGAGATRDWQPTLAIAVAGGPHRLMLNAGRLTQEPGTGPVPDVKTGNLTVDYRYRTGPHEFGVDWTAYVRDPSSGESTRAYRVGLSWTMALDTVAATVPRAGAAPLAVAPLAAAGVTRSPDLLLRLAPGADLEASAKALADGGFGSGVRQPGAIVYEARLLAELEQRQRLALVHDGAKLERAALLVSLADQGSGEDAARVYERARRALLDRFGSPSFTFDEGDFGPRFSQDLAAGRFIRITEWTTQAGTTVRLGIPRRLDGAARIEIHHARRFASPRDTAWGIESIR